MEELKTKLQKWLFGHWKNWWLKKYVRQYAIQQTITADQLLYTKDVAAFRTYLKKEAALKIAHQMMEEGAVVFEERQDISTPARIITARAYVFIRSPLPPSL